MNFFVTGQCYIDIEITLCEKCPYSEFFCSVFSRVQSEYGPEQLQADTFHAVLVNWSLPMTLKAATGGVL